MWRSMQYSRFTISYSCIYRLFQIQYSKRPNYRVILAHEFPKPDRQLKCIHTFSPVSFTPLLSFSTFVSLNTFKHSVFDKTKKKKKCEASKHTQRTTKRYDCVTIRLQWKKKVNHYKSSWYTYFIPCAHMNNKQTQQSTAQREKKLCRCRCD